MRVRIQDMMIDVPGVAGEELQKRISKLEAQLAECRSWLRFFEWRRGGTGEVLTCMLCAGVKPDTETGDLGMTPLIGHAPDCWLAKVLEEK